jgi:hypothetical protein
MKECVAAGVLACAAFVAAPMAHAETMPVKDSPSFSGQQMYSYPLTTQTAGTLSIKLMDLNFPEALNALSFAISTTEGVVERYTGAGDYTLDLASPGTYFAVISATGVGRFALGQASFTMTFAPLAAPVPLPAALLLLLSGGGALGVFARKRSVA